MNGTKSSGPLRAVRWSDPSGTALVRPDSDDALIPLTALARDTSGRATFTRERVGSAVAAAYSSNGATVDYSKSPVLYRSGRGPINYQPGTWQGAVGFGGKIIGVNNAGTFFKWTAATGQVQISATGAITGTIGVFFVDSRGYLYYATSSGRDLSRSTDDGATWTVVLTLPGSSDSHAPMCEDDQGNLYAAAYGSGAGGVDLSVNSRTLWKSTNGGATWVDLSANLPGGSAGINRHIHGVWWDDHRKLLYLSHGDAGLTSVPYVSANRGGSFEAITGLTQCTAMVATPTHVICAFDSATDRRIYRIECSDKASLIANAKTISYDWVADGGLADYTSTTNGFAWFGFEDNQGNVVVAYGKEGTRAALMSSADSGATWAELVTAAGSGVRLFHDQCYVSPFRTDRDGFCYSYDSTLTSVSQWRVYAPGSAIIVDPTADPYVHDGISSPSAGMFAGELRAPGVIQRLAGDITVPILLGAAGVALDRRAYQAGKKLRSAPVVTETFEGAPAGWTSAVYGSGAATLNDTTHAHGGTQAFKADLTPGSGAAGITYAQIRRTTAPWTAVSGSEIWLDGYVWVDTVLLASLTIVEWESTRITLRLQNGIKRIGMFSTTLAVNPGYQQDHEVVAFPTGQWVRLKVAIVAHNTNGRVRVWQDTGTGLRLVLDVMGLVTDSSTIGQNLLIGARTESSGNYTTVWWDDVKFGFNQDPSSPAALTMAVGTALLPDGIYA